VTDNTQARKGGTQPPVSVKETAFLKNVLDSYENPTYHFRLYMVSPNALKGSSAQFGNENERVVIAESGVSPIDIDNVEITTTGSITKEAGTGVATNISFTLREPYGAELLDQIQRAGLALGIQNFQKFPFYLELSFKGRLSSDLGSAADASLSTLVWTWPLQLTSMAMNVNTGGSTYAMSAVAYSDLAYTNQASDTEQLHSITTSTVKDFFSQLQTQLTEREAKKVKSSNYALTDTYTFWIDDDILNASIVPDNKEERENRAADYLESSGKMDFPINPGDSIEMIVRTILSKTSFFHKEMKQTTDPDAAGEAGGGEKAIYSKLWRVVADVELGDYDFNRRDYQRHYKYLIIPYEMTSNLTPSNQLSNMTSAGRVRSHINKGIVRKKYDYIYSGMNDQVFDFELNFNFNWFVALPILGGIPQQIRKAEAAAKQTPGQQEAIAEALKNSPSWQQQYTSVQNALDGLPSGALPGFDPIAQLIEMLKSAAQSVSVGSFDTSAIDDAMGDIKNIENQANDVIGQAENAAGQVTGTAGGLVQDGVAFTNQYTGGVITPLQSPAIPNTPTTLGGITLTKKAERTLPHSPVDPQKSAQKQLRSIDLQLDDIGTTEHEFNIAVTMTEAKTQDKFGKGQQYADSPGQTLLSALFEQAESPISGDLLNIELRVKGDPYWLEPNPHTLNTPPTSSFRRILTTRGIDPEDSGGDESGIREIDITAAEHDDIVSADTTSRQTLMVFRSFTPQAFDPDTGLTPPGRRNVNSIAGLYAVKEVTHSFAGGEFTQTLHGIRDVNINIRDVDLDTDISGIIGGEYKPTVSEYLESNSLGSGLGLTTAGQTSFLATDGSQQTEVNEFFSNGGLNLDLPDIPEFVSIDDLFGTRISGQGNTTEDTTRFTQSVGPTQSDDEG